MFITGPDVIKTVTHEEVAKESSAARARTAARRRRALRVHRRGELLAGIRELLSFLPQNNLEDPPFVPTQDRADRARAALAIARARDPNKPYDIKE
jgi:propionyl-CoA carboxylase beta chain